MLVIFNDFPPLDEGLGLLVKLVNTVFTGLQNLIDMGFHGTLPVTADAPVEKSASMKPA
ncbi:MAG: hypothetical protein HQK99_03265 [Nitrospirae bacterium]|nr:hypothetical protein [Nitrospirota bacterium]